MSVVASGALLGAGKSKRPSRGDLKGLDDAIAALTAREKTKGEAEAAPRQESVAAKGDRDQGRSVRGAGPRISGLPVVFWGRGRNFGGMSEIKIGLIGGTGLGEAILGEIGGERQEITTPFGAPSDAIVEGTWMGASVAVLSRHGPGHTLNPSRVPYRANIFALKALGCTHILASGAVGSLREEYAPRDLVVVDQVIDKTLKRDGTFFDRAAVHVEFAEPFCALLRQTLLESAKTMGDGAAKVHDGGCYVCMEGPAFSTRAESLMHRLWGGDVVGMTAMPEAKLAREAEMAYVLVALVTDYDCWRQKPTVKVEPGQAPAADPKVLLEEIIGNLKAAGDNALALIRKAVEMIAGDPSKVAGSAAREALKLAIWSKKDRIDADEVNRLRPIWGRYFGEATAAGTDVPTMAESVEASVEDSAAGSDSVVEAQAGVASSEAPGTPSGGPTDAGSGR